MDNRTLENLIAVGGKLWQKGDAKRVYFNDLELLLGLEMEYYNTGNIMSAKLNGEKISNRQARDIQVALVTAKFWFDLDGAQQFHAKGIRRVEFDWAVAAIDARLAALATPVEVA